MYDSIIIIMTNTNTMNVIKRLIKLHVPYPGKNIMNPNQSELLSHYDVGFLLSYINA